VIRVHERASVRSRKLYLPLVGLIGAAVAAIPTLAAGSSPSSTASFTAVDYAWDVSGSTATEATIAQGGTVSFSYPSGMNDHNADFGAGPKPSSCTQTAGANSGSVPPLPNQPTAPGWTGSCTFDTAGTYTFHCDLHPYMTATIVVQAPGTTTTTTSTPPTTTTTPTSTTIPSTTPMSTGTSSPLAGDPAKAIALAASQHGTVVHGSVKVSAAGASGRLEVDLFASSRALGGLRRPTRVRVGRLVRDSVRAGTVRFSIPLDAAARRALRAQKRLTLTTSISLASRRGVRVSVTRKLVVHR
jgi:plastocyanin